MTDRLKEIRARLDAATPGPWHWHVDTHRGSVGGYRGPQQAGPPPPALPPAGVEVINPFTGERIFREADNA